MTDRYKLGHFLEDETEKPHSYGNVWALEKTTGPSRFVIAPERGHVRLLQRLSECLSGPFLILYVLVVPRGGAEAGRYQSDDSKSGDQLRDFLFSYEEFFERDARHNLWVLSIEDKGLLVYDRHNVLYGYGPQEKFISVLEACGLAEAAQVRFPSPHAHHYHAEFDREENRLLTTSGWKRSMLRPGDENPDDT